VQLGGRQLAVGEGPVQVEPDPDVHAAQLKRADAGREQPPGQHLGGAGVGGSGVGFVGLGGVGFDDIRGHGGPPLPVISVCGVIR
jgi:hypothetical protein